MACRRRVILPFACIFIFFAAIAAKLFLLQVWYHDELNDRAQKIVCKELRELPCRGMIFDRNGKILSMSVKTYLIFLDFKQIKNIEEIKSALRENNIHLTDKLLAGKTNSSYVPVAENIDMDTASRIRQLNLPGVGFTTKYVRKYPEGKMASHILGLVGRDGYGLEGIEYVANSYLSGEKVKELRVRDGRGRTISSNIENADDYRGSDVYLTIDSNLQFIAEQEIEKAWKESRSKKAIAIVQNPVTGEILAMAIRPNFDPADFSGSWENIRNPAVCDVFEPGSTFKMITSAAALEENVVKRSEVIWCENGRYKIYDHTITDHEKKGLLTFDEVIEYSSNIGTAKIGMRIGKEKFYSYIKQFGFHSLTGIDLPGEAKGLLKSPNDWSGLSLPVISFGQEVGVTAIQMVNAYSALANGGDLIEPKVISEIKTPTGEVLYKDEKRIIRRAVSSKVAAELREMLQGTVDKGTGRLAGVPGYSIGGKTGTAQKRDKRTGRYSSSCYVASFCGIAPLKNPRVTIFVVLDEPQGDYWASSRAAPVFARIASRSLQYMRVPPDNESLHLVKK
ncbi:MAG: penicillin-binding protein 2 [Elusimicrobiota bacterium]